MYLRLLLEKVVKLWKRKKKNDILPHRPVSGTVGIFAEIHSDFQDLFARLFNKRKLAIGKQKRMAGMLHKPAINKTNDL